MKILLILLFATCTLYAQYHKEFRDLIETTYLRTFDSTVVLKYLNSSDFDSSKAALLSISNSGNKNFIDKIINSNPGSLLIEKSFALGKLGADSLSENFLLAHLNEIPTDFDSQRIFFEALGNIISTEKINDFLKSNFQSHGFPFTIVNAVNRKLELNKDSVNNYLLSNLESSENELIFASLFALYRIYPPKESSNYFIDLLDKEFSSREIEIKTYALGCLRRLKIFPIDKTKFSELLKNSDWKVRTELARSAVFSGRFTDLANKYFSLFNDENPNVSRQAAISLREIKPGSLKKSKLDSILNNNFTTNTLGELLISYSTLFPEESERLIEEFHPRISRKVIFEILDNIKDAETRFDLLSNELASSSAYDRIFLSNSLLKLQDEYRRDKDYLKIIISLLRENNAPVISIIADGLSDDFIQMNSSIIQEVILDHLFTKVNNPNFLESIQSLYRLSGKVGTQFQIQTQEIISNSKASSIKQIVLDQVEKENDKMFAEIFNESFKYSEAEIITNKGQFTFEFYSDAAPISVGNFCYLANQNYFDGVKFHRVVPNFVIQTGDSTSTGWGGPGYDIISEFSWYPFDIGAVGMASAGKDTEGSQWFVMHNFYPHLDGNYSVFGKITDGQDIVDMIDQEDVVLDVNLIE